MTYGGEFFRQQTCVTIMCRNDELKNDELSWLFNNRFRATRYMNVKRMGISEILRRIWLFSVNKAEISITTNSPHRRTQLNIAAHNCDISSHLFLCLYVRDNL